MLDDTHRAPRAWPHDEDERPSTGEHEGTVCCPFCDATTVSMIAPFGSQLLMSQFRCGACRSYFEGVRLDRYEASGTGAPPPPPSGVS